MSTGVWFRTTRASAFGLLEGAQPGLGPGGQGVVGPVDGVLDQRRSLACQGGGQLAQVRDERLLRRAHLALAELVGGGEARARRE